MKLFKTILVSLALLIGANTYSQTVEQDTVHHTFTTLVSGTGVLTDTGIRDLNLTDCQAGVFEVTMYRGAFILTVVTDSLEIDFRYRIVTLSPNGMFYTIIDEISNEPFLLAETVIPIHTMVISGEDHSITILTNKDLCN